MVCSERELALGDNHDGIVVLPDDAPVKPGYLGDVVFDLMSRTRLLCWASPGRYRGFDKRTRPLLSGGASL